MPNDVADLSGSGVAVDAVKMSSRVEELRDMTEENLELAKTYAAKIATGTDLNVLYQDCFPLLKLGGLEALIPRLVVFGQQSMGKTTLLDMLMGGPIGYSSTATGTKMPVVIKLHPGADNVVRCMLRGEPVDVNALERKMNEIMSATETITQDELELEISIPKSIHAVFVDLPGIKEDSKEGAALTRDVVRNYVQNNPNDLYLLVKKASDDPANWPWDLREFILADRPKGLGLRADQTMVVGTRSKDFLIAEQNSIKTQDELWKRVQSRSVRDAENHMFPLYLLELFSLSIQDKETLNFENRRIAMENQIISGKQSTMDLINSSFEYSNQTVKEQLERRFDHEYFRKDLNTKFQSRLSKQLCELKQQLISKRNALNKYIKELEQNLEDQEPLRELIKLFFRELMSIVTDIVTGNYMIMRLPETGDAFLTKHGGTLRDNLEAGHNLAINIFPVEQYDRCFLSKMTEFTEEAMRRIDARQNNQRRAKLQAAMQQIVSTAKQVAAAAAPLASAVGPLAAAVKPLAAVVKPLAATAGSLAAAVKPLATSAGSLAGAGGPLVATAGSLAGAAEQFVAAVGPQVSSLEWNAGLAMLNSNTTTIARFQTEVPSVDHMDIMGPGQFVRYAVPRDDTQLLGIVKSTEALENQVACYLLRTSGLPAADRPIDKARTKVVFPLSLAISPTISTNKDFLAWHKIARSDHFIGLEPVTVKSIGQLTPINLWPSNAPNQPRGTAPVTGCDAMAARCKEITSDKIVVDESSLTQIPLSELFIDEEVFYGDDDWKLGTRGTPVKEQSLLQKIAGQPAGTKLLNQMSLTFLARWLKFHICNLEPERRCSDAVNLQMMRSVRHVVDRAVGDPLVADLLQLNVECGILPLAKLAACAASVASQRILEAALAEVTRQVSSGDLSSTLLFLVQSSKFMEEVRSALAEFYRERARTCANEMRDMVFEQTHAIHFETIEDIFGNCGQFEADFLDGYSLCDIIQRVQEGLAARKRRLALADVYAMGATPVLPQSMIHEEVRVHFWIVKMLLAAPLTTKLYMAFIKDIKDKSQHLASEARSTTMAECGLEQFLQRRVLRQVSAIGSGVPRSDSDLQNHFGFESNRAALQVQVDGAKRALEYTELALNSISRVHSMMADKGGVDFLSRLEFAAPGSTVSSSINTSSAVASIVGVHDKHSKHSKKKRRG